MGRASRRKRGRESSGPDVAVSRSAVRSTRARRQLSAIAAFAAVLALSLGWFHYHGTEPTPKPIIILPDPDTSGMTAPVARAIREARLAALARPGSATAVGRLCQVLQAHWLNDEAALCYGIAREHAPEDFRWVYLLAGVDEIRGADGVRTDQLFHEAIRLAPGYPPVYVRYADALMRLGRWSEALDNYAAAIKLDPTLVLAHRGMGQAATSLGDGPAAVEQLEQAAALSPGDRITQVALARAYTLTGQGDRAAEAARKAQSFKSEAGLPDQIFFEIEHLAVDPESLRGRITRSLQQGDYDKAIEALSLLEESAPSARQQLALASKQRANRLAFNGEFDAALAEYERAARLAPTDPEIEHNWGTVLLRRGELELAGRHFERAIEIEPQSADSLYNLGVVLEGLGRKDEAIARFTAAVAIDPRHMAADHLTELGAVSER